MEVIYKNIFIENWVTILLFLCFFMVSIAEYFSRKSYLHSWIQYTPSLRNSREKLAKQQLSISVITRLLVLTVTITFLILLVRKHMNDDPLKISQFLIVLVVMLTFFLSKYYLSKIYSLAIKKEEAIQMFQNLKFFHNGLLGYFILGLVILQNYNPDLFSIENLLFLSLLFIIINISVILYRGRSLILRYPFIFIVYLCTLEIAPYLLLYKYFIV